MQCRKGFFSKFGILKDAAIDSNVAWIDADKLKHGEIFRYKKIVLQISVSQKIKEKEKLSTVMYTRWSAWGTYDEKEYDILKMLAI